MQSLPLFQPGGYVREQARVTAAGQPPPSFRDVYTLDEQPLGEGRYSSVYGATHKKTGARRAIKTAYKRGPNSKVEDVGMECPARLARHEADILKTLDHPNVIRLYEVYEEDDATHLVLELCEGSDILERILVSKGRLPEREIGNIFVQMLFAVSHLHGRGVMHRDLKPEHFLFTRRELDREPNPPGTAAIKVIDFGLSHASGASFVPLGGTPQFMPPEIMKGMKPDASTADRVDMWAMGVVLHAMLVGHYPSPHLTDQTQAAYFAKAAWSSTSRQCLDLLGQLLRQGAAGRPTSAAAIKHPWATAAIAARGSPPIALLAVLPDAVRNYFDAPRLQRIALLATAHELDDFDYYELRVLFQMFLSASGDGRLTTEALKSIAERGGAGSEVAAAFVQASAIRSKLYLSGGGADIVCDWKELLAVTAMAALKTPSSKTSGPAGGIAGLPKVREDDCWRAFDVLSLSAAEITGTSLRRLLAYSPPGPIKEIRSADPPPGTYAPAQTLEALVQDVRRGGPGLPRSEFMQLLAGAETRAATKAQPQRRSGGGSSLFACFRCSKKRGDDEASSAKKASV